MNKRYLILIVFLFIATYGFFNVGGLPSLFPSPPLTYQPRSPIPPSVTEPSPGIYHQRLSSGTHLVYVDLTITPDQALVTPLKSDLLLASTVLDFSTEYHCHLAINGSGFGTYNPLTDTQIAWDRYKQPQPDDPLWSAGAVVTRGFAYPHNLYKDAGNKSAVLSFTKDGLASITPSAAIPTGSYTAIAGHQLLLMDGQSLAGLDDTDLQPRTAVGLDASGSVLIIAIVDGRQPLIGFNGTTYYHLSQLLLDAGARTAMALDGGGSTTLVINGQVVNSPATFSNGFPPRYRAVGPSLGFCP